MRRINTIEELRVEQKALHLRRAQLEAEIKKDIDGIKSDLEPLRVLTTGVKGVLASRSSGVLGTSAGVAADYLIRNTLLKHSGILTRMIVPFLVKNVTSNFVESNKTKITDWVGNLFSKFMNRNNPTEEKA